MAFEVNTSSRLGILNVFGASSVDRTLNMVSILTRSPTSKTVRAIMNFNTGYAGVHQGIDYGPNAVKQILLSGTHYIDYGFWPFGQEQTPADPSDPFTRGFASFIWTCFHSLRFPPISPTKALQTSPIAGIVAASLRGFAVGSDAYDFHLYDWTWGEVANKLGYPYSYGLPTALTGRTAYFIPMPDAPAVHLGGGVNVYSAFALRVGPSWYFEAQPQIDPVSYATFILNVLGLPLPSLSTEHGASCVQTNKPTLSQGATGPYVVLAQERLNAWGQHVTVDGVFGSETERAVLALQRAHDHQYYGGQQVLVTGQIGPGTWNLLCSPPGTRGSRSATISPPSPGSGQPHLTSLCNSRTVQELTRATGLSCTTIEILGIGAGLTLLALLTR
jgi:hypothetical protein